MKAPAINRLIGSVPRGLALFFGSFSVLNLLGNLVSPGFDANLWWIDLRFLPDQGADLLLALISIVLLGFAIRPSQSHFGKQSVACFAGLIALLVAENAVVFWRELFAGRITSSIPIPLSLFVCLSFLLILFSAISPTPQPNSQTSIIGILAVFSFMAVTFPVLQVFCFGKTNYQQPADAIVVLGARAYADGQPSDALADRVQTACELYKANIAKKLIFSGGPGDGDIHETEAMRRYAVSLGVKNSDILTDAGGLNTQATVRNTGPMFKQLKAERILVVSHFYHLPRIKLAYQREGIDVFTVPAKESYFLSEIPFMICREVAALWVYYLRPLTA